MQKSFGQSLMATLRQLRGLPLLLAIAVWLFVLSLGLYCVVGGVGLPAGQATTARPTAYVAPTLQPALTTQAGGAPVVNPATPPPAATTPAGAVTTSPPAQNVPALPWEFGYGIAAQSVVPVAGDYFYTPRQIKEKLGLSWVKQQVRWKDVEPQRGQYNWSLYDPVVDASSQIGLKIMLSIVDAPEWSRSYFDSDPTAAPPDDLSLYAGFLGQVIERYKGRIQAIEVWNEENLAREWDTAQGVNAARYVEMLRLAYQAIKSRDPNIIVISGALSPTGVDGIDPANPNRLTSLDDFRYLQQMIDAGALQYTDCVGVHHNGYNIGPNVPYDQVPNDPTATFRGPFDSPHHSWSFYTTLWVYHDLIQKAGSNIPLCITEFGWASAEGWSQVPPAFEFSWDNTLLEQAQWTVEAFQSMRQWGFVRLAFLWNLDYGLKGGVGETDPNAPYSIVDFNGAPRPAFDALERMPKVP